MLVSFGILLRGIFDKGIFVKGLVGFIFLFATTLSLAQNKVVVIPMSGDDIKPLKNIVSVARENGDFNDPVAAMLSITNASSTNPYLLVIAPGVYPLDSQLVMKEYVDITGSGQNSTILTGSIGTSDLNASSALVVGSSNASLRNLQLINENGAGSRGFGIYNSGTSNLKLSELSITLSGAGLHIGAYNISSSSPTMDNITIVVSGATGSQQYGVLNDNSSSPAMNNMTITVSDGTSNQYGVFNDNSSSPTLSRMTINVLDGTSNQYGIFNNGNSSSAVIRSSNISAPTNSISTTAGIPRTFVSNSFLTGLVTDGLVCSFVFTNNGSVLNDNCQFTIPPPPPPP